MNKHEYLERENFYETRSVGKKGRITKMCAHCGKDIPKGQPHDVHHFYPEFEAYPTHIMNSDHGDNLKPGEKSCSQLFLESLN